MIVFDLECRAGAHRFEAWFGDSADFIAQAERGLLSCPVCGDADVVKALTAPRLGKKGNQAVAPRQMTVADKPLPAEAQAMIHKLAAMQAETIKNSTWVGDDFAEASRALHYGERDHATIHGQATIDDASALREEGIAIMPLPFPIAPPDSLN